MSERDPFADLPDVSVLRRRPVPVTATLAGDDPFAALPDRPSAASMWADAGESMGGELRQLAGRGLASTARTAGQQVGLLGRAANALTGGNIVVAAPVEWAAGKIRDTGASIAEKIDEMTGAPQTTGERIAGAVGTAAPVVASYALAGKAAGSLPAGASFASRVGAQVLAGAPVTAAIEGDQQDGSLAQTLGRVTGSDTLNRLSETAGGRMAVGLAGDVLGAGVFEGLASGFRGAGRLLRGGEQAAPRSLDEAADEILRQHGAATQPAQAEGRASTWGDLMPPDAPPPAAPAPRPPVPPVPAPAEPVAVPSVRDAAPPAGEPVPLKRRAAFAVDRSLEAELQAAQAERRAAQRAADTDPLTGVASRAALDRALPAAERDAGTHVVVFDANNFGKINKTAGQEAGDAAIKDIGAAVRQAAGEFGVGERVFRRGGDEFVVLAPADVADQVRARAEAIFGERDFGGHRVSLSGTAAPTFAEADGTLQAAKQARKTAAGPDLTGLADKLSEALGRPVAPDEVKRLLLERATPDAAGNAAGREVAGLGDAAGQEAARGAGDLGGRPADLGDTGRGAAPAAAPGAAAGVAPPPLVMGADGQPLVVYHATDNPHVAFDRDVPTYFSDSPKGWVGQHRVEANVRARNALTPAVAKERVEDIARAFQQHGVDPKQAEEILRYIRRNDPSAFFLVPPEVQRAYQSLGYDALHVDDGLTSNWWVPFSNKQIESRAAASGNRAAAGVAAPAVPAGRQPFAEMRTAAGRLRPVVNVSDDGLIRELSALMDRRGAQDTSHRLAETDYGDVLTLGSSRQGRAIQRVNDDTRLIQQVSAELERRGWTGERMGERALELTAEADERAALQGDFDASKTDFSPDRYGRTSVHALAPLVGGGAGAVAGSRVGDTPEERRRNAAIGAVAGASLGYLGARLLKSPAHVVNPAGLNDPAVARVLTSVATGPAKALPKTAVGEVAAKAYREMVDALYPLRQFGRAMGGSHELSAEVTRAGGWQGAGESRLRTALEPVLKQAKGIEPQVVALATAERALELARNGLPNKGVDLAAAQRAATSLSKIPEVRKATDALRGYYRDLLDYKLANGVIAQDAYDALVKKGESYIPFVRDMDAVKSGGEGGSRGLAQFGTGVRKMTDAEAVSAIRNPFEQAVIDTYQTERTVSRQRVTNVVATLYDSDPTLAKQFLEEVPMDRAAREGPIVRVTLEGKARAFEVKDPEIYNAWASLAPQSQDYAGKFLGVFKKGLQTGVTMNPAFALSNATRDLIHTAAAYPLSLGRIAGGAAAGAAAGAAVSDDKVKGAITGAALGAAAGHLGPHALRTAQALGDIIGHGAGNRAIYEQWLKEGGTGFGYFPRTPRDAQKMVEDLTRKGMFDASKVVNPKSWWNALHTINSAIEEAPRLARYKAMLEQGASKAEAAAASRDVSLDFSRMGAGKTTRLLSGSTAFFNPKVQGWDKLFRMFIAERNAAGALRFGPAQAKAWATAATAITAPSVALWAINKDNPEYWNRPLWERNLFWLVPDGDGGFYKIPKPFELGYAFASVPERFLDYAHEKNPGMFKDALWQMASSTAGEMPMPTAVQPLLENMMGPGGYSMFRNQPVVSQDLQRLPNEMQYDDRTSSLARGVGSVTGASPQKVDNLVQGWGGTLGQQASSAVTTVARRTGLDDRGAPTMPQDRGSLAQRFTARADATPASVTKFYSTFADAEKINAGLDRLQSRGESAAVQKFLARNERKLQDYYRMKPIADALKSLNEARRAVEQDASTPVEERRRQILEFRQQAAELAQQAIAPQP